MKSVLPPLAFTFSALLLYALGGCTPKGGTPAKAAPPPQFAQQVARYYPLAVGNSWTYQGAMVGINTKRTISIIKKNAQGFVDNLGATLRVDEYGLRDHQRYLLRGPLKEGTEWMSIPSVSAVERYQITGIGKSITVPAGRFEGCISVRSTTRLTTRRNLVNEIDFAPKVGIIRIRTFMVEDKKVTTPQVDMRLAAYSLK